MLGHICDNYRETARYYRLTNSQKKQLLHHILSKDAKLFYFNVVVLHKATFQQALDHISAEYNSPLRQNRVENYQSSLTISKLGANNTEFF